MKSSKIKVGLTIVLLNVYLVSFGPVSAQQVNYQQPPNSSYLAEYGLSTNIFNIIISPMYQEDARFHAKYTNTEKEGTKETRSEYELIYDPFYEYGLTMKLIVHDPSVYAHTRKSQLKRLVGKNNEKYKKIRGSSIVTEEDVGLILDEGNLVVLGFRLKKENLPNYLNHLSTMEGRVYLSGTNLDSIELKITEPLKFKGMNTQEGKIAVYFQKMDAGGYLVKGMSEHFKGTRAGEPIEVTESIEMIKYLDKNGDILDSFQPFSTSQINVTDNPDTLQVKLERALPLLGNAARKAGYELPLPYGVDLFNHFQQELLGLEKVILNDEDLTDLLAPGQSSARAITNLVAVRGDVWLLPFLNFTLMGGQFYGNTEINLELNEDVKEALELLGIPADNVTATTNISGPLFGAGITLAGGYENFFATVNTMYIKQFVSEAGTEVEAMAITPLIGLRLPKIVNVVVGGQYQIYDSKVSGSIKLEDESLNYSVNLKSKRWNWLIGLQRDFSNHWNGTVMVGPEPRPQATVVLGYRF